MRSSAARERSGTLLTSGRETLADVPSQLRINRVSFPGDFVVDPFFLPLPLLSPSNADNWNLPSFKRMEEYFDIALCSLRTMAERLRTSVGTEALEPEWNRFLDGIDPVKQSEIVARLDALVSQRKETEAVSLLRELLLVTWDQAFDCYAGWSSWDRVRKMRCLQMAELRKLFAVLAPSQPKLNSNQGEID